MYNTDAELNKKFDETKSLNFPDLDADGIYSLRVVPVPFRFFSALAMKSFSGRGVYPRIPSLILPVERFSLYARVDAFKSF